MGAGWSVGHPLLGAAMRAGARVLQVNDAHWRVVCPRAQARSLRALVAGSGLAPGPERRFSSAWTDGPVLVLLTAGTPSLGEWAAGVAQVACGLDEQVRAGVPHPLLPAAADLAGSLEALMAARRAGEAWALHAADQLSGQVPVEAGDLLSDGPFGSSFCARGSRAPLLGVLLADALAESAQDVGLPLDRGAWRSDADAAWQALWERPGLLRVAAALAA